MVAVKSIIVLLVLGAEALAGPAKPTICSTFLGTKTIKNVPSSTVTVDQKITIVKKVIRKVNVIVVPVAKITTIRTTKVDTVTSTANQETDTAWDTVTSESTTVSTRTSWTTTTTVSTTTTTKDITSTVTRPAAFTPIEGPGWVPKRRGEHVERDKEIKTALPAGTLPQSVRCVINRPTYSTKTVSTTVQGARRTLNAATKTKMATISTITTKTEYLPNAKTTKTTTVYPTTTSFVDVTSTSVITQTVTVESQIPIATVYDMCSSDNILLSVNGGGQVANWDGLTNDYSEVFVGSDYTTTACCQACAQHPACQMSLLQSNGNCLIYPRANTASCANNNQVKFGTYYTTNDPNQASGYILSNGPCGYWQNGGVYGD